MSNEEAAWQLGESFAPSPQFASAANAGDPAIYARAEQNPEAWWAEWALKLQWDQPWTEVLQWTPPHAKWFVGGRLNAATNCVHRHLATHRRHRRAIVWEGEPGDTRTLTYEELSQQVVRFASVLKDLGVQRGDRVMLYMPMVPEAAVAMLACAHIGAPHSVVFGGFSADSLKERTQDCAAKVVVTADGYWRRGKVVPLKQTVDEALADCPDVKHVVVLKRSGTDVEMQSGRDVWWHTLMESARDVCDAEPMESEDPLFVLYTSGSTGKPKGILHTTGGYLTGVTATSKLVFDLKDDDLYWCTADVGWVTGHSYVVYGPLANGATVFMYEGSPDWGSSGAVARDRFWEMIERHRITILYTAPTLIRACMKWGDEHPAGHDLSSLRLIGSVGEPINPEAWLWYNRHIGHGRCPIVDTWWQTETGAIMITPLPGLTTTRPGSASRPFPGIIADVVDEAGTPVPPGRKGILVIRNPWPSMLRTIWGDDDRYQQVYWSRFPGLYFPGDGALRDDAGNFWLLGRIDDIMLVAGHNISTMEMESVLVEHPAVAEAAVIGRTHDVKGQAPVAFVIIRESRLADMTTAELRDALSNELKEFVAHRLGAICRPDEVILTADLPKTRSGKIMRRLLRDIAEGRILGDTTTLADPAVVASLQELHAGEEA
ncbi:MAG: acetate--CoA ligase [Armatimonadetes bacterium]|nr:acetate--CoA ligase [Armatimonadota bacterium]MDE2206152.1 acetate--CoA ligase [Armatimonadota bacterium]